MARTRVDASSWPSRVSWSDIPYAAQPATSASARASCACVARDRRVPASGEAAVDPLRRRDRTDLDDRVVHRPLQADRRVAPGKARHPSHRRRVDRRAPAAVAAGRAEPDVLLVEHDDPQRRVGLGQVVRRPEAGVPGPDDHDVGVAVARERRVGRRRARHGRAPQRGRAGTQVGAHGPQSGRGPDRRAGTHRYESTSLRRNLRHARASSTAAYATDRTAPRPMSCHTTGSLNASTHAPM